MNKLLTIFIVSACFSCTYQKAPSEEELRGAIGQFNRAFEIGDVGSLSTMITENYVHTNGSWKSFGKEKWLEYMTARSQRLERGELVIEQYLMDQVSIEIHDNSAILTARIISSGLENGDVFEKNFRISNYWVFNGSRWLRAGFHDTIID